MKDKHTFLTINNIYFIAFILFFLQTDTVTAQRPISPIINVDSIRYMSNMFSGIAYIPPRRNIGVIDFINPSSKQSFLCPTQLPAQNIDGTCNNIATNQTADWGATGIELRRAVPAAYGINNSLAGANRPNPRHISNKICKATTNRLSSKLSSLVFTWGQFIDHDITLTPESNSNADLAPIFPDPNCPGDPITTPIGFHRSLAHPGTGGFGTVRQQTNLITSWLDGSNVYGDDNMRVNWLRAFTNGKLRVSGGNLLPFNTFGFQKTGTVSPFAPFTASMNPAAPAFVAGDVRVNEQPGLTAMHTLFVREHNRICNQLVFAGMTNDQAIYEKARRTVSGIIQNITYEEFLPAMGVNLPNYTGYNNATQPDIMNLFATAAYRLGHTMVTEELELVDNSGNLVTTISLEDAFFDPCAIPNNGGIEPFLNGLAQQLQGEVDVEIVEQLRTLLFGGGGVGIDLAALNIQRGRDHGLPDYNTIRLQFTGTTATNFSNITSDPVLAGKLAAVYGSVNDIDPWIGLLAEDHLPGTFLGTTLHNILLEQFKRLRDGDFYYFQNDPALTAAEKAIISNTTLADVVLRNTTISSFPSSAFCVPCPNFKVLFNPTHNIGSGTTIKHEVNHTIVAFNEVQSGANVIYDAGIRILLRPNFLAEAGSNFLAVIDGCGGVYKTQDNTTPIALEETNEIPNTTFEPSIKVAPNPFSQQTQIILDLSQESAVSLDIYNLTGQKIATLAQQEQRDAGQHQFSFDADDLPNGTYLVRMQIGKQLVTKKLILLR